MQGDFLNLLASCAGSSERTIESHEVTDGLIEELAYRASTAMLVDWEDLSSCDDSLDLIEAVRRWTDSSETDTEVVGTTENTVEIAAQPVSSDFCFRTAVSQVDSLAESTTRSGSLVDDRYRIIREIGRGSCSKVLLALDEYEDRHVAVKLPRSSRTVSCEAILQSFTAGAHRVRSLRHENILPTYFVGVWNDQPFLVLKYAARGSVREAIDSRRMPLGWCMFAIERIADALAYAHGHGMVHYDIKPGNLMIDAVGTPLLGDFGIAPFVPQEGFTRHMLGTPAYMSPEQLCGRTHEVDSRSDLFSLGVVLFELLTGHRPFSGPGRAELHRRILEDEPPPASRLNHDLPMVIDHILQKALAKDPERRYESACQLRSELQRCRADWSAGRSRHGPPGTPLPCPMTSSNTTPTTLSTRNIAMKLRNWLETLRTKIFLGTRRQVIRKRTERLETVECLEDRTLLAIPTIDSFIEDGANTAYYKDGPNSVPPQTESVRDLAEITRQIFDVDILYGGGSETFRLKNVNSSFRAHWYENGTPTNDVDTGGSNNQVGHNDSFATIGNHGVAVILCSGQDSGPCESHEDTIHHTHRFRRFIFPDLHARGGVTGAQSLIELGQSLSGNLTVRNDGNFASPTATLTMYRSSSATSIVGATVIATHTITPIAAGGTRSFAFSTTPTQAGRFYIHWVIDTGADIDDRDEWFPTSPGDWDPVDLARYVRDGNNSSIPSTDPDGGVAFGFDVNSSPDVNLRGFANFDVTPEPLTQGDTFNVAYEVQNNGSDNITDSFTVSFYVSRDDNIDPAVDHLLGSTSVAGLNAGAVFVDTESFALPPAGHGFYDSDTGYSIGMFVDSTNAIDETNESDNRNRGNSVDRDPLIINPPPNFNLRGFANFDVTPEPLTQGDTFNVAYEVQNNGSDNITDSFTVSFYVSRDDNIDPAVDHLLGSTSVAGLNAGAVFVDTESFALPPAGHGFYDSDTGYSIGMFVDSTNAIDETNESDNRNRGNSVDRDPLIINPPPNFNLRGFANFDVTPEPLTQGDTFNVAYEVQNNGSDNITDSFTVSFYVSRDDNIDPAVDHLLGSTSVAGLNAGAVFVDTESFALPPAGHGFYDSDTGYSIGMFVDSTNAIDETNESDNRNRGNSVDRDPLIINPPPNFNLRGFANFDVTPEPLTQGDTFNVAYEVQNNGSDNITDSFTVSFYVSRDDNIDPAVDHLLGSTSVAGLNAGAVFVDTESFALPPAGHGFYDSDTGYSIGMFVDSTNAIDETNESDNRNRGNSVDRDPLIINPPPNFNLRGFANFDVTPEPLTQGDTFNVAYEVQNNGSDNITDSFTVSFYVSRDDNIDPAVDHLLGSTSVAGLNAGAVFVDTESFALPPAGHGFYDSDTGYSIGMFVDSTNAIDETNESDNRNRGNSVDRDPLIINPPPPPPGHDFDMGTPTSPVEPGFIRVDHTTLYTSAAGFGWLSTDGLQSRDYPEEPSLLNRDFVKIPPAVAPADFAVDVTNNQTYEVTFTIGSARNSLNEVVVLLEGMEVARVSPGHREYVTRTVSKFVIDGQLNVTLLAEGGTSAVINRLSVTEVDPGPGAPEVTLGVSPSAVFEDGTENLVYTFVRTGDTSSALTVNFDVSGDATFNNDYTQSGADSFSATSGTVTIAAGQSSRQVIVDPSSDATVEANETLTLTLAAGAGYTVVAPSFATGTIANDDTVPQVTLGVSPSAVFEDGTENLVYTFVRTGDTSSALTVNFDVSGDATFNNDYTQSGADSFSATSGTVTIAAGQSSRQVIVDPSSDATVEANETLTLTLAAGAGYTVVAPSFATGTIANDDTVPPPPGHDFDMGTPTSPVEPGFIRVDHTTLYTSAAGFGWLSTDGLQSRDYPEEPSLLNRDFVKIPPAVAPADFAVDVTNNQTYEVTFTIGSARNSLNEVVVLLEGMEVARVSPGHREYVTRTVSKFVIDGQLNVTLLAEGGTSAVINRLSVTEVDPGPGAPEVTLGVSPSAVFEDGTENLVYTFVRTGDTSSALTVNFDVSGDATFNNDYTQSGADSFSATSGTVTIAAGQSSRQVIVDPSSDATVEANETLTLTLAAGAGYTVVAPSFATGTIANDDTVPPPPGHDFDMGTPTSPVEPGFIRVDHTTLYTSAAGFGWLSTDGLQSRDYPEEPSLLNRDFVRIPRGQSTDFALDLPNNQTYDVTFSIGSARNSLNEVVVLLEGMEVARVSPTARDYVMLTRSRLVTDGQLNITIVGAGSSNAVINYISVVAADRGPTVVSPSAAPMILARELATALTPESGLSDVGLDRLNPAVDDSGSFTMGIKSVPERWLPETRKSRRQNEPDDILSDLDRVFVEHLGTALDNWSSTYRDGKGSRSA